MNITEQMLSKAGLTKDEAKAIRYTHNLPSAGKKTKKWVEEDIDEKKYNDLLQSAYEKLERTES